MVVAIAPWSLVVHPGKKISYEVIRDFKVTNAALGAKLQDEKARSTLKVTYEPPNPLTDSEDDGDEAPPKKTEKTEISLCSLTPGSVSIITVSSIISLAYLDCRLNRYDFLRMKRVSLIFSAGILRHHIP